jgi:methionine-rich copper-binding protein CopC
LAAGAVVEISIENLQFIPNRVKVEKGTTVRWTNRDTVAHTIFVTDLETESRVINPGESYQFTFSQDAFLGYICGIHPFMTASLLVGAAVDPFPKNVTPEGPPPRVISIEPNRAPADTAGTEIAIKGENFRNGSTAFFHHLFGKVTFIDSNMLHVKTPSHYADKTGVIVTNPDGQFHNFTDFTFYQTTTTPTPTQQPSELGVEVRTIHFVSSTPAHGVTLTSSPAVVAVDFNFQVVQTSNIRVFRGTEIVAQGGVAAGNNLRLEVKPPNLSPGVYKVEYHAVWPGGSFHDGQFYFRIA